MKNHVTHLMCLGMCLMFNCLFLTGQNIPDLSLKIGEETADSIVFYDSSGEKIWVTTDVWNEPVCRLFVDEQSEPTKFFVNIGITYDFLFRVRYVYDVATTEVTYEGNNLSSLTYPMDMVNEDIPYYGEIRKINYSYNEAGQILFIEEKDEHNNIQFQQSFSYNSNGDLKSYEIRYWSWTYNGDTNKPIPGTGKLASIRSQDWEFDAQGKKIKTELYRENLIYTDEPIGKYLKQYAIFHYPEHPTSNKQVDLSKSVAYVSGNTLYIETAHQEQISVYSINGSKLYGALIQPGTTPIEIAKLTKGIVIIQGSSGWTKKVMVK